MDFKDIPQFPLSTYSTDVGWNYLKVWIEEINSYKTNKLELDPEYQRGYVWTPAQQIAYVEYKLRGGRSAGDLYFNCNSWGTDYTDPLELLDGKQRLNAVLAFLNNEIPAFGTLYKDFTGKLSQFTRFHVHILKLGSPVEVVKWYLAFNTGGSIHTETDLAPAFNLLKKLEC
jgi:hypothetical protein